MDTRLQLFTCFHLNLSYSSIEIAQHAEVIQRCYWPLLQLAEMLNCRLGIEVSGHTLERIHQLDPEWVAQFKQLIYEQRCELVGSGYVQLIGPLVPPQINQVNQQRGMKTYQSLLGVQPAIALVNEQAWSVSMVDHYREAGYRAVIMEWDNPAEQHREWPREWRYHPQMVGREEETPMALIWNQSIQFQRFQRYVHGELVLEDFIDELSQHLSTESRYLSLYGNDVEVFDFRPGRFSTEASLEEGVEWRRIGQLFERIQQDDRFALVLPSQVLEAGPKEKCGWNLLDLQSPLFPIPVKKQRKYNIARWAITGCDDLWLNSCCHRFTRLLDKHAGIALDPEERERVEQRLCRLWASDLRTHLTEKRWQDTLEEVAWFEQRLGKDLPSGGPSGFSGEPIQRYTSAELIALGTVLIGDTQLSWDPQRHHLEIRNEHLHCTLNLFRGGSILALAYRSHDFVPIIGTITQGYFEEIELGADFYSGVMVVERSVEHTRTTDLNYPDDWSIIRDEEGIHLQISFHQAKGVFKKRITVSEQCETLGYAIDLSNWSREQGTVRIGHFTLLPPVGEGLAVECKHGGDEWERFSLDEISCRGVRHGAPASTLVTSTSGLGSSSGEVVVESDGRRLGVCWDPAACALFPMLDLQQATPSRLARLIFSLSEMDETWREGGRLLPAQLWLSPA